MRSLARSLVIYGKIETTEAKAKELRPFIERLITTAKKDTLASRRQLISKLSSEAIANKLINNIAPSFDKREGGYTRVIKLGTDKAGAPKAVIEFVK